MVERVEGRKGMGFIDFVESTRPVLQVALDYTRLEDAVWLASLLRRSLGGEFIVEVGTPLIKSEGMRAVSLVKSVSEPLPVLADTKTADVGWLEARLASEHGASAVTVLGCAPDDTIAGMVREAEKLGLAVVADLIGVRDVAGRVEELWSLGVRIVELHVGIDVQQRLGVTAADLLETVKTVHKKFPGLVAVAGGLNASTVPLVVEAGADIVVVGGAITKSSSPVEAAREILGRLRR